MDKSLLVEKKIEIHVNPDSVWHAITDRDSIQQFFFGTEAVSDWKKGSSLIFQGEWEGQSYQDKGIILESVPGSLLKYSYWSAFTGMEDLPENYSIVTYRLEANEKGTITHLTQRGFSSEEAKKHSEGGWDMVLTNLKKLLEGEMS